MSKAKSQEKQSETSSGDKKKLRKKERKLREGAKLAKHQRFEIRRVHRRDIKGADYNPRQIDDHARKKLKENLKKKGLLSPLVWNERTSNLVSGHQRLSIMDDIEGTDNYLLDVAVVNLSDKEEKEQNIFFNNASAMGQWDIDLLGTMLSDKDANVDYKSAGFDDMDLQVLLDDTEYATTMFDMDEAPKAVKDDVEELEKIQEMKRARKQFKDEDIDENDTEFMAIVVFPNRKAQARFMERCGVDGNERYIDGVRLYSQLEAIKPSSKGEFEEVNFWVPKSAKKVVENEVTRISSLLEGKNVRGRALEFMAVNSSQTELDNLTGEPQYADDSSEPDDISDIERARLKKEKKQRRLEKKRKKKERKAREESSK